MNQLHILLINLEYQFTHRTPLSLLDRKCFTDFLWINRNVKVLDTSNHFAAKVRWRYQLKIMQKHIDAGKPLKICISQNYFARLICKNRIAFEIQDLVICDRTIWCDRVLSALDKCTTGLPDLLYPIRQLCTALLFALLRFPIISSNIQGVPYKLR